MSNREPRSQHITLSTSEGSFRLHYLEWGDPKAPVVCCAHGLTRNARDFDFLAKALCQEYRVISIDYPGRGQSDWRQDPLDYAIPLYAELSLALITHLEIRNLDWIGTSMGGIIGMVLATNPQAGIGRLVLNDVGAVIPLPALQRISRYLAIRQDFDSLNEFEQHLRVIHAPFGPISDPQWQHMAQHGHRLNDAGKYEHHYDPEIVQVFAMTSEDIDLWSFWEALHQPTLLIRGAESDLLSEDTADEMALRRPGTKVYTVADAGHAPSLMAADQIESIKEWLRTTEA